MWCIATTPKITSFGVFFSSLLFDFFHFFFLQLLVLPSPSPSLLLILLQCRKCWICLTPIAVRTLDAKRLYIFRRTALRRWHNMAYWERCAQCWGREITYRVVCRQCLLVGSSREGRWEKKIRKEYDENWAKRNPQRRARESTIA